MNNITVQFIQFHVIKFLKGQEDLTFCRWTELEKKKLGPLLSGQEGGKET